MLDTVNYIIATYAGKTGSRVGDSMSEHVLDLQLVNLHKILQDKKAKNIDNQIGQITIVVPKVKPEHETYASYYQWDKWEKMFGPLLKRLDYVGLNKHHSYDQYIQAILKYPNFTYSLLIEDDYCIHPSKIDFDTILIQEFKQRCGTEGYLCSLVDPGGNPGIRYSVCKTGGEYSYKFIQLEKSPLHAGISNGLVSTFSIAKLGSLALDEFYSIGYTPQIVFSVFFTNLGLPLKDLTDKYAARFFYSGTNIIKNLSQSTDDLFVPIQDVYSLYK